MTQTMAIERTIEGIELKYGLMAVVECQAYVQIDTLLADPSVGIPDSSFEYDFTGEVFTTDISVWDSEDNYILAELSDSERKSIAGIAIRRYKQEVKWGHWDSSVHEEIASELADREIQAAYAAADAKMERMREG